MSFWATWKDADGVEHTAGTCDVAAIDDAPVEILVEYYRSFGPPAPVGPVLVREGERFDPAAPAVAFVVERLKAAIVARRADATPDLLARVRRLRAELTSDLVDIHRTPADYSGSMTFGEATRLSAVLTKLDELVPEAAPAAPTGGSDV